MMIRQFRLVPPTIMLTTWGRVRLKIVLNLKIVKQTTFSLQQVLDIPNESISTESGPPTNETRPAGDGL